LSNSISHLIADYRNSAAAHGAATEVGDHKNANKHHDRLTQELLQLRTSGSAGDQALLGLLNDENSWVRLWAASHLLRVYEDQARRTLEMLSNGPGILAFDAQMVLSEWGKGTLKTP